MGGGGGALDSEAVKSPVVSRKEIEAYLEESTPKDVFKVLFGWFENVVNTEAPVQVTFRRVDSETYEITMFHENASVETRNEVFTIATVGNSDMKYPMLLAEPFALSGVEERYDFGVYVEEESTRRDIIVSQRGQVVRLLTKGSSLFRHDTARKGTQMTIRFDDDESPDVGKLHTTIRFASLETSLDVFYKTVRGRGEVALEEEF